MGVLDGLNLPNLNQQQGRAVPKGRTRLEVKMDAKPLTKIDETQFKTAVWTRDRKRCRCCGRKVAKSIERIPERGEVHHCHGRTGDLRFEPRAAILTCLKCHERLTGKVNAHRLTATPSKTFTIRQGTFTDATYPVTFKEAV